MNQNRILFNLIILLCIISGCKKDVSEESEIPVSWHESMTGNILVTWESTDGYTHGRIFWINENGITKLTGCEPCGHLLECAGWSPDGTMIVFGCWWGTWIKSIDGTGCQNIDSSRSSYPTWSPDGSMIAFGGPTTLCIFNLENEELMYFDPGLTPTHLDWSPDGTKIVFENTGPLGYGRVNVFDFTDSSFFDFGEPSYSPAWSPDGKSIAFIMYDDNNISQVFISSPDGTNRKNLTHSSSSIPGPLAWSPDGELIAIVSIDGIYIINLQGIAITRIFEDSSFHFGCIDWRK